jgi:hypothetical protein
MLFFFMCACLIEALDNIEVFVNQDILPHSILLDLITLLNMLLLVKLKSKSSNGWESFLLFPKR